MSEQDGEWNVWTETEPEVFEELHQLESTAVKYQDDSAWYV